MVLNDTIRLLRECNAGVKMGISSVEEMLPKVENTKLKDLLPNILKSCKNDDQYFYKLRRMKYSLDILLMVITFLLRMKKAISK